MTISDHGDLSSRWRGCPWEDTCARQSLTGQAGGGVDPFEQLPDTQLATLVGVARQHQLAHLHLRGVPVPPAVPHGPGGLRARGGLPGCAVREYRGDALGNSGDRKVSLLQALPGPLSQDLSATGGAETPQGPPPTSPQLQQWPPPSSLGSQSPGCSLDAISAQFPSGHQLVLAEPWLNLREEEGSSVLPSAGGPVG